MSLTQWHKNGWVRNHKTSKKEISSLFSTEEDVNELIDYVQELRTEVVDWLNKSHSELV